MQDYPDLRAGSAGDAGEGLHSLLRLWQIVLKRWTVVLPSFVLAVAIGLAVSVLTEPTFRSSALLQLQRQATRTVDVPGVAPVESPNDGEFYETQLQLLRSRAVTERIAARLGSDNTIDAIIDAPSWWQSLSFVILGRGAGEAGETGGGPEARLLEMLQAGLMIEPVVDALSNEILQWHRMEGVKQEGLVIYPWARSLLVRIHFDSPDPVLSARVVTAVAAELVESNTRSRNEANAFALKFLEDRLEQMRVVLEDSEHVLAKRSPRDRSALIGSAPALQAGDLTSLSASLNAATRERIDAEVRFRQSQGKSIYSHPELLQNEGIVALRLARSKLEAEYQTGLLTYMPDFPIMLQLRSRIEQTSKQLAARSQEFRSELSSDLRDARDKEQMLRSQVDTLAADVMASQGRASGLSALERDVAANQNLYDALLQRYREIGATANLDSRNVTLIDGALVPERPIKPEVNRIMRAAVLSGLLLGVILAFIIEALDRTIKSPEDIEKHLGLAVLGVIPSLGGASRVQAFRNPRSAFSEAYRSVRTALEFSTGEGAPRCLLITSPAAAEGKSTTALTLARDFAQLGRRVLLIDADLRNPSLHSLLGAGNAVGLSNYLSGNARLPATIRPTRMPRLLFIPSGPLPPNPAELLAGAKMASLLSLAGEKFDQVIIDGPPIMGLADAPILSCIATGTVLVIAAEAGRVETAKAATKRLLSVRARIAGAVLTKVRTTAEVVVEEPAMSGAYARTAIQPRRA
jgi:polysaccharide biosynthesis transport protein